MAECHIEFSQKVTNREMAIHGEVEIQRMVVAAFLQVVRKEILGKIELQSQVCGLVAEPDYTLSPYRFSQQFGTEYTTSLIIMTPEDLAEHDRALCESCGVDQMAYQTFSALDQVNC